CSNLPQSARNSAQSAVRAAVNIASKRAASSALRPEAFRDRACPPARSVSVTARPMPSANTGTSGTAHTPWPRESAPALRNSRQTATRCRDGSAGSLITRTSQRLPGSLLDTSSNVAAVTSVTVSSESSGGERSGGQQPEQRHPDHDPVDDEGVEGVL